MKTLYIELDTVFMDFQSGIARLSDDVRKEFEGRLDKAPNIFSLMDPNPYAIDSFRELSSLFDTFVLSTEPWSNSVAWPDKLQWVAQYLGNEARERLVITHYKHLKMGEFLIDDKTRSGVEEFRGEHLYLGTDRFPDWSTILSYLRTKAV